MTTASSPEALAQRAAELAEQGQVVAAMDALKQAVKQKPDMLQAWLHLSRLLFETGNFAQAVQVTQAAERFDPLGADFMTIQNQMQSKAYAAAEQTAKQMLTKQPGHPRAVFTLAHVSGLKNNPEGRAEVLRYGLSHSPANLMLRNQLVHALDEAGDYAGAIEAARILVQTQESFASLWTLVSVLLRHGRNEELLEVCDRARTHADGEKDKLSEIELVRGQILRVMGHRDEAVAAFRSALANNSANTGAWWGLADMKTYTFSEDDQAEIQAVLNRPDIPPAARSLATFALAKTQEATGDPDVIMPLYEQANRLNDRANFDPKQFSEAIERRIAAFDAAALAVQADRVPDGPIPIFILGLPRSGSTLLEQILASHSQIEGTIEQPTLPSIARKAHATCVLQHQGDFLDKVGALTTAELSELGAAYLSDGALFRLQGRAYFTDKLPFNFLHIGLIHKILPNAVIIDARRNPLDCGLSLFKQHFTTGVDFSYDLAHIGAYYQTYLRLMDHWDAVLPGRVIRVQHETLVCDPEPEIRRMLNQIGVDFEPACLSFHQTDRAVRTASSEQVRQPINTKGIGAWRKVERHLEPLKDGLGEAVLRRFDGLYEA